MAAMSTAEFDAQVAVAVGDYRRGTLDAPALLERIERLAARANRPAEALARAAGTIGKLPRRATDSFRV
ncbi:hypothetical protein EON77_07525 [bacterium]|nr:MAG: hypothetical protein EON77_07525 [bacterium]